MIVHLFKEAKESSKMGDRSQMLIAIVKLVKAVQYQAELVVKIEELMKHAEEHYDRDENYRDGFHVRTLYLLVATHMSLLHSLQEEVMEAGKEFESVGNTMGAIYSLIRAHMDVIFSSSTTKPGVVDLGQNKCRTSARKRFDKAKKDLPVTIPPDESQLILSSITIPCVVSSPVFPSVPLFGGDAGFVV